MFFVCIYIYIHICIHTSMYILVFRVCIHMLIYLIYIYICIYAFDVVLVTLGKGSM